MMSLIETMISMIIGMIAPFMTWGGMRGVVRVVDAWRNSCLYSQIISVTVSPSEGS
ncbi:hypothetical protein [Candidatus Methanoliparum sp. LAM-1]|uniref:hypothetical protein n=1 Tax=Candidatus Methanoliparum sp. LAM-1 TaxID=2874846 RepID=UPI001E56A55E|nr:hypothetical protein [Candidatus Methanoliparum sp. LAM-1]